jgi:hypothetical protein
VAKPENQYWLQIKKWQKGDWNKGETSIPGMPDLDVCWSGISFKVELKVAHPSNGKIHIRKAQRIWIERRIRHSGIVFLFAKISKTNTSIWLGKDVREIMEADNAKHYPRAEMILENTELGWQTFYNYLYWLK